MILVLLGSSCNLVLCIITAHVVKSKIRLKGQIDLGETPVKD